MTSLPMHNMVKIAAFGGLFFAATFVAERHPDFYGEWSTILPVLVMISMFANLCLSPGSSCLAVILFWCSIGALLVYEGERADRRATHEMEVGTIVFSMLHIGLLLVVCTSRGIAKLIERVMSIGAADRAVEPESDADDREPASFRTSDPDRPET